MNFGRLPSPMNARHSTASRSSVRRQLGSGMRTTGIVLLLTGLVGCSEEVLVEEEVIRPVRAMKVADPSEFDSRRFPGQAKATQELELSFRVAGPLIARPVDVGTVVKAGDLVAKIDPRDFQVSLRSAESQLEDAQATLKRAESDFRRLKSVYEKDPGATSEASVDRAEESRDSALANVSALEASVEDAQNRLGYTTMSAPFDGAVVATYIENYEDVRAKQPVVRIVDDSSVEMIISIPENLISFAPAVTDIHVTFDAFPDRQVPAEIKEVGTEASDITRTYPVTLIMEQPEDIKILPGMAGRATGTPPAEAFGTAMELPVSAVFSPDETGTTYVWVIDESAGTVARRAVEVDTLTPNGVQVTSGLEPGEWVATAGVHYLTEGQKVRILEGERS